MRAAVARALGRNRLDGLSVAVQGLGAVGARLCQLLHEAGARLVVADIDPGKVTRMVEEFAAEGVAANRAHAAKVDVFAPCALGAVLNERTIPAIQARVVAGSANNQLATVADGRQLMERNILYAPDYVINAGGAIAIACEGPDFDINRLKRRVESIGTTLERIFARSSSDGCPPSQVADLLAEERLARAATGSA
jgi:leucine dehydrogenase